MTLSENISVQPYNSFGIDAGARYFTRFTSLDELKEVQEMLAQKNISETLVLGGGSNILFTKNFNGCVLRNEIKGTKLVGEDETYYYIKAHAGENWHSFVIHCIGQQYAGLENLSLIPGNVGASPMQNIGAYGVEIRDVFHELEAWHVQDKTLQLFTTGDCEFGYRESIFKRKYKGQFIICSVTFRLRKQPVYHTAYGALEQELEKAGTQELSIKAISDAVIRIRSSKLPDPSLIGNAGSFFKNPVIGTAQYSALKEVYPLLPGYPSAEQTIKLAAGWLIEQCGWKGYRAGDAGCYPKQALVLVNYGKASGKEIYDLSQAIIDSVLTKFGVLLEREVNIL